MSSESRRTDHDRHLRKPDYEITDELQIKDKLHRDTLHLLQYEKAEKFQYDLAVYRYDQPPFSREEDRHHVGYIEVERSRDEGWICGDPRGEWCFWSFLRRKVHKFDNTTGWGGLKEDHDNTLYVKFSNDMTECFAAPITQIHERGSTTKDDDGTYKNSYLSLDFDDDDDIVRFGRSNVKDFIERFFSPA